MTLLDVDEFRGIDAAAAVEDEALQLLLDAAEAEISSVAGPVGDVTEIITSGGRLVVLRRPASSVSAITETSYATNEVTTLASDDYLAWPGGYVFERLGGGTNSRHDWYGRVAVTYTPADDVDIRKIVQADLVRLMINYTPGITSETVGAWTTQLAANSVWNASLERAAILARLSPSGRMAVV